MVVRTLAVPFAIPLSPPHSPPMSDTGYKSEEQQPQPAIANPGIGTYGSTPALEAQPTTGLHENVVTSESQAKQHSRPPLRSHKSFPYSLGPSSRVQDEAFQDTSGTDVLGDFAERVLSSGPQPTASANLQQPTYGGSAPTSPTGQLSAGSLKVEEHDVQIEDEDIELGDVEDEEDTAEKRPMTAAELRAHKRKMKRFRYETLSSRDRPARANPHCQAYSQSDPLLDERVRATSASRCGASREIVSRDTRLKSTPGSSLVPEQVSIFETTSFETC